MAKTDFRSVDQYLASKPPEVRAVLDRVRDAIRNALPDAEETISYQIPVYKVNGVAALFFAGWKEHYSLYPASDAMVAAFKKELAGYELSKGTIRFPLHEPVPVRLVERIAKFRAQQLSARKTRSGETQLDRVRRICATMPSVTEKVSHGAPTFFVHKDRGVFTMFANNHHSDGHLAVWLPVPAGMQSVLIEDAPETYFKPPYVGVSGWVGIELAEISDEALAIHVRQAWDIAAKKRKKA